MAWKLVVAAAISLATASARAEPAAQPAIARLSVARLFAAPSLSGAVGEAVRPSPDGRWVAFMRHASDDPAVATLWLLPARGGAPRLLLDGRALGHAPEHESVEAMKERERHYQTSAAAFDYRWGADGDMLVIRFAGDLYLLPAAGGAPRRLSQTEGEELDPKLAPGGRYLSYTRGQDLFVRDLAPGGGEHAIAGDASASIFYGRAEFVAQEEIRRFDGQWWSPDGAHLAFTRVDESRVRMLPRLLIDAAGTRIAEERYPLTGTANAEVRVLIGRPEGGAPVEVDLGADKDYYLARAAWSRDGRTFYVERQSRDQKRLDLLAADAATGATRVLLTETSATWVDVADDFRPLADGSFLWGSSREGARYLYLYDRDGRLIRRVTPAPYRLTSYSVAAPEGVGPLAGVDERRGLAFFGSSPDTPLETGLYSVSYRRPGVPRRLTATGGWWLPVMPERSAAWFVATYSDPATPPRTALYASDGRRIAWIAENRLDAAHPLFPYLGGRPAYEFGTISASDGTPLYYALGKPAGFDPRRRYPVIVRPYGGPNVQTVRHEWRSVTEQVLTEAGYIVFTLDNRGMMNRDIAFEHALAGRLDSPSMEDQLAGVRFIRSLPYVDPDRIGMMGWSFGAYTTVRMMTEPGSGVRAGAAGGTPADFALYDTYYTERFLGTPQADPQGYRAGALLPRLGQLDGALLLMHGLADDNVVVQNFTAAVAELQARGKLFETSVYPGMGHVPRGPNVLATQLDFFNRRLAPR